MTKYITTIIVATTVNHCARMTYLALRMSIRLDVRREEAFTHLSPTKSFRHLIIYIISLISVFSKKNPINEKLEL